MELVDLNPNNIYFSQETISKEYEWNSNLYLTPIIVAEYGNGEYCSYDNRRLYAAQNHKRMQDSNFVLSCDVNLWDREMDLQRTERNDGIFDYFLWFTSNDESNASTSLND